MSDPLRSLMVMFIDFDETGGDVIDRLVELDRVSARVEAVQAELLVEAASLEARVDEYALFVADSRGAADGPDRGRRSATSWAARCAGRRW